MRNIEPLCQMHCHDRKAEEFANLNERYVHVDFHCHLLCVQTRTYVTSYCERSDSSRAHAPSHSKLLYIIVTHPFNMCAGRRLVAAIGSESGINTMNVRLPGHAGKLARIKSIDSESFGFLQRRSDKESKFG